MKKVEKNGKDELATTQKVMEIGLDGRLKNEQRRND